MAEGRGGGHFICALAWNTRVKKLEDIQINNVTIRHISSLFQEMITKINKIRIILLKRYVDERTPQNRQCLSFET